MVLDPAAQVTTERYCPGSGSLQYLSLHVWRISLEGIWFYVYFSQVLNLRRWSKSWVWSSATRSYHHVAERHSSTFVSKWNPKFSLNSASWLLA